MTEVAVRVKRGAKGSFVITDIPGAARRKLEAAIPPGTKSGPICHLILPQKPKVNRK